MRAIKIIERNLVTPEEETKFIQEIEILRQLVISSCYPRIILT